MITSDPPRTDLAGAGPLSVHLDERDRSATLTLQRPGLPAGAPREWRDRGCNSHETSTTYVDIADVTVDGWSHRPLDHWSVTGHPDPARVTVTLTGPAQHLTFHAHRTPVTRTRGLLTGSF